MIDISVNLNGAHIAHMHISPKELIEKSDDGRSKWTYIWFYSQLMAKENVGGEIDAWAQDGVVNLAKDIFSKISSDENIQKFATHIDPAELKEPKEEPKNEQKEKSIIETV